MGGRPFALFTSEPGRIKNAKKTCGGSNRLAQQLLGRQWRDMPNGDKDLYYARVAEMAQNSLADKESLVAIIKLLLRSGASVEAKSGVWSTLGRGAAWKAYDREMMELMMPFVKQPTAIITEGRRIRMAVFYHLLAAYGADMPMLTQECLAVARANSRPSQWCGKLLCLLRIVFI